MATPAISRADAKAKGLSRYFTGKPCKHGHVAERITANGVCTECIAAIEERYRNSHREQFREKWRKASAKAQLINPQREREKKRRWAKANQEKVDAYIKRWKAANPERCRAFDKKWRTANPAKIAKKNKNYKTLHAERLKPIAIVRVKKWRKENPEGVRRNSQTRRARKKGAAGSHTAEQLLQLLERQRFKCAGCTTSVKDKRHIDHIMPLARGGSNDIRNLQWLCPVCNNKKHAKDPIAWAQENGRLL